MLANQQEKHMKRILGIAIAGAASISAHANLVANGGFEVNTVNTGVLRYWGDTADSWTKVLTTPDMWDNAGVQGNLPGDSGYMTGVTAFGGTKWAGIGTYSYMWGNNNWARYKEGIESSSMSLSAGQLYDASAMILYDSTNSSGWNNPGIITIRLKGTGPSFVVGTFAPNTLPKTWQARSLQFTVPTTGMYSLIMSMESGPDAYVGIDDVGCAPVPEPATVAALGAGLATLLRKRRCRRA
ncbi:MAG: hypothetical protein HONBIEJF_01089 [Fimbriimonadaceae bacterium]|nr:hypothetical protein [Fimbriimonadaceae bacterium]